METYTTIIVILAVIALIKCDWIEIPQTISSDTKKLTKKTDLTMYILTTTSTTTQTPVFVKPVVTHKKANITKIANKSNSSTRNTTTTTTTTGTPIFAKPTPLGKKRTNSNNTTKSNSSARRPAIGQTSSTTKKPTVSNKKENITTKSSKIVNQVQKNEAKNVPKADHEINNHTTSNVTAKNATNTSNAEFNQTDDYYDDQVEEPVTSDRGSFSYASFIPYMSTIQSALMRNAHKNKLSKVGVLTTLRDHLMVEIENRISTLWSPKKEETTTKGREAREYKDDSHMDFPSNEGALMTIGFLTFAVFLIKLVLQLVQALANKTDNGDGTTTTTIIGRKRRGIKDEEAVKILNYIDQYQFKRF